MADQYVSKVVYGDETLIDLTSDTVTADTLLRGVTAHKRDGSSIMGTCDYNNNTTGATAQNSEILYGRTAYARGMMIVGVMPNNGETTLTITTRGQQVRIPQGYHDGSGKALIDSTEAGKIIPTNIRSGVSILGVTGTMTGTESVSAQTVSVTPSTSAQTITPESPYNYISQVDVAAIPYSEASNSSGGITVTIG